MADGRHEEALAACQAALDGLVRVAGTERRLDVAALYGQAGKKKKNKKQKLYKKLNVQKMTMGKKERKI